MAAMAQCSHEDRRHLSQVLAAALSVCVLRSGWRTAINKWRLESPKCPVICLPVAVWASAGNKRLNTETETWPSVYMPSSVFCVRLYVWKRGVVEVVEKEVRIVAGGCCVKVVSSSILAGCWWIRAPALDLQRRGVWCRDAEEFEAFCLIFIWKLTFKQVKSSCWELWSYYLIT